MTKAWSCFPALMSWRGAAVLTQKLQRGEAPKPTVGPQRIQESSCGPDICTDSVDAEHDERMACSYNDDFGRDDAGAAQRHDAGVGGASGDEAVDSAACPHSS